MTIKKGTETIATSGNTEWGCIEGTLRDQEDLKNVLDLKAPLLSPAFTGIPTAPTATLGTTTNQIATTSFVGTAVSTADSNVVHLTGDETINGTKTFTQPIQGTAYRALWGDLAEYYLVDEQYPKGTLVQFGGEKEITIASNKVNAVITSEPGFILNDSAEDSQAIALIGRVPVRVIGKVKKFDKIGLSYINGVGCANNETEKPIGIALEDKIDDDESLVLCSVKIDLV